MKYKCKMSAWGYQTKTIAIEAITKNRAIVLTKSNVHKHFGRDIKVFIDVEIDTGKD